jgi:hypothetical protein
MMSKSPAEIALLARQIALVIVLARSASPQEICASPVMLRVIAEAAMGLDDNDEDVKALVRVIPQALFGTAAAEAYR